MNKGNQIKNKNNVYMVRKMWYGQTRNREYQLGLYVMS